MRKGWGEGSIPYPLFFFFCARLLCTHVNAAHTPTLHDHREREREKPR